MSARFLRTLFALCALLKLSVPSQTQTGLTAEQTDSIRALIRRTMDAYRVPGASFAIGLAGKVAWSEGFGYADVENQVKPRPTRPIAPPRSESR